MLLSTSLNYAYVSFCKLMMLTCREIYLAGYSSLVSMVKNGNNQKSPT
jgi:hypothetical protein